MTLLEVSDLHTRYGAIEALKGISLTVDAGEVVTLIGSNGAGKSTTLRSISGLTPASAGTITFAGEDITRVPAQRDRHPRHRARARGPPLLPAHDRSENLDLGAHRRRGPGIAEDLIASTTFSPGSRSVSTRRPARCPAASSRCSRSGGR
jgi:ABC-type branched-chain amino acid transport systems, ATPase component